MNLIILLILVLLLFGGFSAPVWSHSQNWGYYPTGGIGLVVVILIILLLTGRI